MRVSYGPRLGKYPAEEEEVMFSLLSGYGLYVPAKGETAMLGGGTACLVAHMEDGPLFYARPLPAPYDKPTRSQEQLEHWRRLIERPPVREHFVWPVDLVENVRGELLLVFPVEESPSRWKPLTRRLSNVRGSRPFADFGREAARRWIPADIPLPAEARRVTIPSRTESAVLADNILTAWSQLHDAGYLYLGFNPGNVFWDPSNLSVRFGFSPATCAFGGEGVADSLYTVHPLCAPGETPFLSLDFIDPLAWRRLTQGEDRDADLRLVADAFTEEFCIASVLFRLLVGRLPYYGPRVSFEPNGSASEHADWLGLYHANPVFIFSEFDNSNSVGGPHGFSEDELFRSNWEALPKAVRAGFSLMFEWGWQEMSRKLPKEAEAGWPSEERVVKALEGERAAGHSTSKILEGLTYLGPERWLCALASDEKGKTS